MFCPQLLIWKMLDNEWRCIKTTQEEEATPSDQSRFCYRRRPSDGCRPKSSGHFLQSQNRSILAFASHLAKVHRPHFSRFVLRGGASHWPPQIYGQLFASSCVLAPFIWTRPSFVDMRNLPPNGSLALHHTPGFPCNSSTTTMTNAMIFPAQSFCTAGKFGS